MRRFLTNFRPFIFFTVLTNFRIYITSKSHRAWPVRSKVSVFFSQNSVTISSTSTVGSSFFTDFLFIKVASLLLDF